MPHTVDVERFIALIIAGMNRFDVPERGDLVWDIFLIAGDRNSGSESQSTMQ